LHVQYPVVAARQTCDFATPPSAAKASAGWAAGAGSLAVTDRHV